jgi:predicted PurR-regulated permease PerM
MQPEARRINIPLAVMALVASGVALIALKGILMPLAVAFFLANLAGPSVGFMKRKGIPMGLSLIIILLLTALVLFLIGRIFYSQVPDFIVEIPKYQERLEGVYENIRLNLPEKVNAALDIDWSEALPASKVAQTIAGTLGSLFSMLGTLLLILLYMAFLLPERDQLPHRLKVAYDEKEMGRIVSIIETIQKQTESYIVGKATTSLITGILATAVLWAFGVKFFFIWGLLTFLLNFIPNIGSFIATVFPILMALVQPDPAFGLTKIVFLAASLILIQFVVGSIIEPRLLGARLRLSPIVVFLSFLLWGWLWGVPGMILSVPIMATIKIVLENIEPLKPVAVLLSNESERPASGGKRPAPGGERPAK